MQLEQKTFSNYKTRALRMKDKLVKAPHEICIERAKSFTGSYKNTKGENPIIRFAKAMDYYLMNMTIKIWDDEYIVGNRCIKFVGTPLYPEVRIDTIEQDIDNYDIRPIQKLFLTNDARRLIKEEIIPYWKDEEMTVQERFQYYLDSNLRDIMEKLVFAVDVKLSSGIVHFFPSHEIVLKNGISGLIHKAKENLRNSSENGNKETFYDSVIILLNATKKFMQRFSALAQKMANNEQNLERQEELYSISKICSNISQNKPNNFEEAL